AAGACRVEGCRELVRQRVMAHDRTQIMLRRLGLVLAAVLVGTTLSSCHELYCNFIEGLTGQPIDRTHDAFPDLGSIQLPPLPPPPSLPTTTTTTETAPTIPGTTTTTEPETTTTSSS